MRAASLSRKTSYCSYLATFFRSSFTGMSNEMYNGHYWGLVNSKTKELMRDSLMYTSSSCFANLTCNHFLNIFVTPQFLLCCHIYTFASREIAMCDERYILRALVFANHLHSKDDFCLPKPHFYTKQQSGSICYLSTTYISLLSPF